MRLELATFDVRDVVYSNTTRLLDGVLYVDLDKIKGLATEDRHFESARVHLVRPGERTRVINVLDAVEPRCKVSGQGTVFPGILGPPVTVGRGRTHRLSNLTVVATSQPLNGEPVYWRDAVLDMSGAGARYNLFADNLLLVIELDPGEGKVRDERGDRDVTSHEFGSEGVQEYNLAARAAGFKVANYLAECTRGLTPDRVEAYELGPGAQGLPRVVFCCQMIRHLVYGRRFGWQPSFVHPNELMDGCLFNIHNAPACGRESTHFFQNHPVVHRLYSKHGKEIDFLGVMLLRGQVMGQEAKERSTRYAAKLLKMVGVEGLVLTWTGTGNPGVDTMMLSKWCERMGIKTAVINSEMAPDKEDSGITYFPPEADGVVSAGNYEEPIDLPAMERVIGGTRINSPEIEASGPLSLTLRYLYGATNVTGASRLGGVSY